MVEQRSIPLGREESERNAEGDREDHRRQGQLDGRRKPMPELIGHGPARGDAVAEVALERCLHVLLVLDEDRAIEAVLMPQLGDRRRGRPFAQQRLGRTSGQRPNPGEDQERNPDEDRKEEQQPADDETKQLRRRLRALRPSSDQPSETSEYRSIWTGLGSRFLTRRWAAIADLLCANGTPGRNFMM